MLINPFSRVKGICLLATKYRISSHLEAWPKKKKKEFNEKFPLDSISKKKNH